MKKLVITLVVLALLAVGLDRGGVYVAEQVAGSSLQTSQGLEERPEVTIDGIPFLDQLATGRYERIEVRALGVPVGDGVDLELSSLDVVLVGVRASRDFDRFDVRRARASALVSYADLSDALGIDLAFSGDGELTASRTFTVLDQEVTPSVTIEPAVVDGALSFGAFTVDGAADVAGVVTDALEEVLGVTVPLQGIPFDIDVDDLRAQRDGLRLDLSGSDLSYVAP